MKILIIGANGYVGARIFYDLSKQFETFGTYNKNKLSKKLIHLDITSKKNVNNLITKLKPSIIIHVANNSSAKWCEANKSQAKELNQTATNHIVEAANQVNTKIIYISSFAAIEHSDTYGKTKFSSENTIKRTVAGYLILRLSLILGYSPNTVNDRPFNRILRNIDEQTPAVYDTSWKFKLTYLGHVSEVIKMALKEDNMWNDTISIAIDGLRTRYGVSRDILKHFGIKPSRTNLNDQTPINHEDLSKFKSLNIPKTTYQLVIKTIIDEIRNRKKFQL